MFWVLALCQSDHSPYCSPLISKEANKENLFHNQELLLLVIISILMTFMFDSGGYCEEKLDSSLS